LCKRKDYGGNEKDVRWHCSGLQGTFLVMMKLVPMASELETARARPMYLSSIMAPSEAGGEGGAGWRRANLSLNEQEV
jgi:hypothetical protein